jgi:hypothetical protein
MMGERHGQILKFLVLSIGIGVVIDFDEHFCCQAKQFVNPTTPATPWITAQMTHTEH